MSVITCILLCFCFFHFNRSSPPPHPPARCLTWRGAFEGGLGLQKKYVDDLVHELSGVYTVSDILLVCCCCCCCCCYRVKNVSVPSLPFLSPLDLSHGVSTRFRRRTSESCFSVQARSPSCGGRWQARACRGWRGDGRADCQTSKGFMTGTKRMPRMSRYCPSSNVLMVNYDSWIPGRPFLGLFLADVRLPSAMIYACTALTFCCCCCPWSVLPL